MAFKDLSLPDRLVAVHTDFLKHSTFCILGGVTQIGNVHVDDTTPTAKTNGSDVYYGAAFIRDMSRKQLRYLVGHENMHKSLRHCTEYINLSKKYPDLIGIAMDYVVNGTLEDMDTGVDKFLERPTSVPPLVDPKYSGMSVPEVLRELLKDPPPPPPKGGSGGAKPGKGSPLDVHVMVELTPENIEELQDLEQKISDAVRHGEILQGQLKAARGEGAGSTALSGFRDRPTDWRPYFRRFFQELCEGDDQSRFSPPNKRLLPMDIIMPSRFSEAMGEIIIASDTSGSMSSILPVVFGEVARICQTIKPSQVRVLWWDTQIAGEQVFKPADFPNIAHAMAPKGGGGTTVSCVAHYIKAKKYKYKAVIMISDGYVESQYDVPEGNVLWGVIDNESFVPRRGKVLHINSEV